MRWVILDMETPTDKNLEPMGRNPSCGIVEVVDNKDP